MNLFTQLKICDIINKNYLKEMDHVDSIGKRWRRWIILGGEHTFGIEKDDNVNLMLNVFNSYTGKAGFGFEVMAYRSYCENGMVFGKQNFTRSIERLINKFKESIG
ncbi:MAG: hypothetical protein ACOC56_01120, partial [Atribacterota bacterium]